MQHGGGQQAVLGGAALLAGIGASCAS